MSGPGLVTLRRDLGWHLLRPKGDNTAERQRVMDDWMTAVARDAKRARQRTFGDAVPHVCSPKANDS